MTPPTSGNPDAISRNRLRLHMDHLPGCASDYERSRHGGVVSLMRKQSGWRSIPLEVRRMSDRERGDRPGFSRRVFLEGTGAAVVAATATSSIEAQTPDSKTTSPAVPRTTVRLTINGTARRV